MRLALTEAQQASMDEHARKVDLHLIGYDIGGEDARNLARWENRKPATWARLIANALYEAWMERRGGLFPYPTAYVARAILMTMEER